MRRLSLVLVLISLAGCFSTGGTFVQVRRTSGMEGRWEAAHEQNHTVLECEGTTAHLLFSGRTFELRGVGELRGMIAPRQVDLRGSRLHVYGEDMNFHVKVRDKVTSVDLTKLAPGIVIYEAGALRVAPAPMRR